MKRLISAFLVVALTSVTFAQTPLQKDIPLNNQAAQNEVLTPAIPVFDFIPKQAIVRLPEPAPDYKLNAANSRYSRVLVGQSNYGLQTNSSIARRVILHPDGKVSTVWTTAADQSPYNTRGSGYNFFDGNSWKPTVETRLEQYRTGWPNIITYDNGTNKIEYVVSHYAEAGGGSGGYSINYNTGIGSTSWTEIEKDKGTGPIWPRIGVGGDYLHIFGTYSDTNVIRNGMKRPSVYSRYNLKTNTWVNDKILIPGFDTSIFKFGTADDYSIAVKDNVVAIVYGFYDIYLFKSLDYGATWERTLVNKYIPRKPKYYGDTVWYRYSDGAVNVIIDKNNTCHIFSGTFRGFVFNPKSDSTWYQPYSHGILYWNDIYEWDSILVKDTIFKDTTVYRLWVDDVKVPAITFMFDTSWNYTFNTADSTITKSPKTAMTLKLHNNPAKPFDFITMKAWPIYYTYSKWDTLTGNPLDSALVPPDSVIVQDSFIFEIVDKVITNYNKFKVYPNTGIIPSTQIYDKNQNGILEVSQASINNTSTAGGGRYGSTSLVTHPHATIDDNGNIFLIYSAVLDSVFCPIDGANYRDVWIVYSTDFGQTWCDLPQNISNNPLMEDAFGTIAFDHDNYLHIQFQEDEEPGTDVQNGDAPSINYIYYMKVPVNDVLNDLIGQGSGIGIKETPSAGFKLSKVYPNPADEEAIIRVDLTSQTNIAISLVNMMGQKVFERTFVNLNSGSNFLHIDISSLPEGVYFINANNGTTTQTHKIIVK